MRSRASRWRRRTSTPTSTRARNTVPISSTSWQDAPWRRAASRSSRSPGNPPPFPLSRLRERDGARAIRTVEKARRLRTNRTDVERLVWSRIRDRQLSGHKFRRQVPIGRYVVDFVCREAALIIELDGGKHASIAKCDVNRTRWLEQHGWRVLRFRITSRTPLRFSVTSIFQKRSTRQPCCSSHRVRLTSHLAIEACLPPSSSMISAASLQTKSTTYRPIGTWRRNLWPESCRSLILDHTRRSTSVRLVRSRRAFSTVRIALAPSLSRKRERGKGGGLPGDRDERLAARRHGASCHDVDEMGTVFRARVDVGVEVRRRHLDALDRISGEGFRQRLLHLGDAEDAGAGAGHRHAHAGRTLGDEDTDDGIARGRVGELGIGGLVDRWKTHRRDDLAGLQGGLEHAGEEIVAGDLALVGGDGGAQRDDGAGIVGGGIVIGDRAADRAAIAYLRVADTVGEVGEGRDRRFDNIRMGDVGMAGHGADDDGIG